MLFIETILKGAFIVKLEAIQDGRGFFARSWCYKEFENKGIMTHILQENLSFNRQAGTVRGMHYQEKPFQENKLVRCTRGAIYDVALDLRQESPTYLRWFGAELTADNYTMLYVPEGFAHGYQTLTDDAEVVYQVSQVYSPQAERGVRYDDPAFAIVWPLPASVISAKDRSWPDYAADEPAGPWADTGRAARNGRRK
jgi:dTDP-4-dehydrorhamnose 3,5-epimerase